jgi:hypothetical protein
MKDFRCRGHFTCKARQLDDVEMQNAGQEIADAFIYLIHVCEELDLDLIEETAKKLKIMKRGSRQNLSASESRSQKVEK